MSVSSTPSHSSSSIGDLLGGVSVRPVPLLSGSDGRQAQGHPHSHSHSHSDSHPSQIDSNDHATLLANALAAVPKYEQALARLTMKHLSVSQRIPSRHSNSSSSARTTQTTTTSAASTSTTATGANGKIKVTRPRPRTTIEGAHTDPTTKTLGTSAVNTGGRPVWTYNNSTPTPTSTSSSSTPSSSFPSVQKFKSSSAPSPSSSSTNPPSRVRRAVPVTGAANSSVTQTVASSNSTSTTHTLPPSPLPPPPPHNSTSTGTISRARQRPSASNLFVSHEVPKRVHSTSTLIKDPIPPADPPSDSLDLAFPLPIAKSVTLASRGGSTGGSTGGSQSNTDRKERQSRLRHHHDFTLTASFPHTPVPVVPVTVPSLSLPHHSGRSIPKKNSALSSASTASAKSATANLAATAHSISASSSSSNRPIDTEYDDYGCDREADDDYDDDDDDDDAHDIEEALSNDDNAYDDGDYESESSIEGVAEVACSFDGDPASHPDDIGHFSPTSTEAHALSEIGSRTASLNEAPISGACTSTSMSVHGENGSGGAAMSGSDELSQHLSSTLALTCRLSESPPDTPSPLAASAIGVVPAPNSLHPPRHRGKSKHNRSSLRPFTPLAAPIGQTTMTSSNATAAAGAGAASSMGATSTKLFDSPPKRRSSKHQAELSRARASRQSVGTNKLPVSRHAKLTQAHREEVAHSHANQSAHVHAHPSAHLSPHAPMPDDEVALMYDPILKCYYEPQTNKYYQLHT